jgi:chromosome partitioning protein
MVSIAVVNQKGGVGKTTVALGLASAASAAGQRVLVVDLDPQANASTGLGVWEPEITVDHALEHDQPGALVDVVLASSWALADAYPPEVAASSPQLAQREPQLANDPIGAQDRLQVALEGIDHDLVIIDCPPSLGLLTVNGLFAADRALVVTEPGAWASDGVEQILRTVNRIAARRPGGLGVAGIVVNRLGRTRDARYWYDQLVETYADQVLPPVRLRAAIPEAAAQSLPIHGLGARAGAADAAAEFDALLTAIFPELGRSADEPEADPDAERAVDAAIVGQAVPMDDGLGDQDLVLEVELDEGAPSDATPAIDLTDAVSSSVGDPGGWPA